MISKKYVEALARKNPARARGIAWKMFQGAIRAYYGTGLTVGKRQRAGDLMIKWHDVYMDIREIKAAA